MAGFSGAAVGVRPEIQGPKKADEEPWLDCYDQELAELHAEQADDDLARASAEREAELAPPPPLSRGRGGGRGGRGAGGRRIKSIIIKSANGVDGCCADGPCGGDHRGSKVTFWDDQDNQEGFQGPPR